MSNDRKFRNPVSAPPGADAGLWTALVREAEVRGFRVAIKPTGGSLDAFTDYQANEVVLAAHLRGVAAMTRLAHEVGHVHLHAAGSLRGPFSVFEDSHGLREVEAEIFAYVVLVHHGISNDESLGFIAQWAWYLRPDAPEKYADEASARVTDAAKQVVASTRAYMRQHSTAVSSDPTREAAPPFDQPGPGW
ncbi:hypothetical protein GCM10029976_042570 [Kribbella albertanoniae]|uniref:ImmA/IrrE family metallo-endopeptidase n=1 Tax=Kribbella albertanoniae TaxID=1266829 RepID=A0A4R4QEL5_9ACTN|nr:ImmA/IrrE family metallo-endopeptidase [Kribbella albertanoniae]TDC34041.1 ImmA/IrrE family metallo-endopeptidase [Kribbella albertanoniae]